jgi:hypothetical protein
MNLCPKCNKWEVEEGQIYCLSCSSKRTNIFVKVGEAVVVAIIAVAIILFKRNKEE